MTGGPPHAFPSFDHSAVGPLPWSQFALLSVAWTLSMWASAAFLGVEPTLALAIAGFVGFFVLLPKDEPYSLIPGWTGWILGVAFFGGIFLAAYAAEIEAHLIGPAGALWIVWWFQLALWLRERFGDPIALPASPQPLSSTVDGSQPLPATPRAWPPIPAPAAPAALPPPPPPPPQFADPAFAVADRRSLDSKRLGARVIDALLIGVVAAVIAEQVGVDWLAWLLVLWGTAAYFFVCEATTGQTLGKRAAGLRVVRPDGQPASANATAVRNVIRLVEEPFIALLVLAGSGRRRQRIGDLAAGTTVGRAEGSSPPARSRLVFVYPALWAATAALIVLIAGPPRIATQSNASGAFANQIDRACVAGWQAGDQRMADTQLRAEQLHLSFRETAGKMAQAAAVRQMLVHDNLTTLTAPPDQAELFGRWLSLVAAVAVSWRQESAAWNESGRHWLVRAQDQRMELTNRADSLGRQLGLETCLFGEKPLAA